MPRLAARHLAALAAAFVLLMPELAQADWVRAAPLTEAQAREIVSSARQRRVMLQQMNTYIPYFRVRAQTRTLMVCRVDSGGLWCREEEQGLTCPTEVQLNIPGEPPLTLPVTCRGPDPSGNCECDATP